MRKLYLFFFVTIISLFAGAQEISITGNKFTMEGSDIWFTGINTPWHLFDDFGRNDFDPQWWEDEFARYKANHINLARVWIHGSGEVSPDIDASGHVSGVSASFWEHMDKLMEVSRTSQVYVMPALLSFDITKSSYPTHQRWRAWLQSEENIQSYIDNVLIPMVSRYENEPYLLAWEICNEPEWMFENSEHGPQSFYDVQKMHAMLAAAVHENSSKMVTTGSAAPKWNSPIYDHWGEYEGNMFSDSALSASASNPNAFLDFYQYHWYPWQSEYMASPFTATTVHYDVDDRPVIVGESEGNNVCDAYICQTVTEMYENAYNNGFDGVCAWKTPQNDGHGTFENIAAATNAFYNNHPNLVYPDGSDPVSVSGVSISETAITIEERLSHTLTATVSPGDATDKRVNWSSSNTNVATVANGVVTAVAEGTATVTIETIDGGYTANCMVTVTGRENGCSGATAISLPFSYNGAGVYCWETSGSVEYINSWGVDYIEINGEVFTNVYSNTLPPRIDGKYFIFYEATAGNAHFEINGTDDGGEVTYYNLTTNVVGQGSVSPALGSYEEGAQVILTATPASGYVFDNWSGDVIGTASTVTITMNSNKSVTANFVEDTGNPVFYTLTTSVIGQGTVSNVAGDYEEGTNVSITATPATGYVFDHWSGDASGTAESITVVMNSDKSVVANFVIDTGGGDETCDSPITASLPLVQDGSGDFCWVVTGNVSYINSWNMVLVEINGIDYTNTWSSSMPPKIDGKYYIRYSGAFPWSHLEVNGASPARTGTNIVGQDINDAEIIMYPNPVDNGSMVSIDLREMKFTNPVNISIYDLKGVLVYAEESGSKEVVSIRAILPGGIYTVKVFSKKDLIAAKQLIVK